MAPERTAQISRRLGHHFSFHERQRVNTFELVCTCGAGKVGNHGQINKFAVEHTMQIADDALYAAGWNHQTLDEYLEEHAGIADAG